MHNNHLNTFKWRAYSIVMLILVIGAFCSVPAQPAGGRVTTGADTKPTTKTKPASNATSKETPKSSARPSAGALERIDGKWWTTGNDFGESQVIFSQEGPRITGVINWADGRSGSVNGTLNGKRLQFTWKDSKGNGGSGWLELSWANFLGGPCHNQRVRDGSWTMNRIEGKSCLGGKRDRMRTVTNDAAGKLTIIMDDGTEEEGHMDGPWLFLSSEFGDIKGSMFYKGNRVDWANGQFWTWCGR
jgi:hypothetical protein